MPWEGLRNAFAFSAAAPQPAPLPNSLYHPGNLPQSEDCLTLNVWTNAAEASERRPVMVWFHLGAFVFGASSGTTGPGGRILFDGAALAELGPIVVTVNYRLGRLGFLAHPWLTEESAHGSSGNYGFLDQVAALQWVKDNIAGFGGDPENVTIFGVSAGSASCSLHMVSPLSKGLFHKVVASSGGFMGKASRHSGLFDRLLTLAAAETRGCEVTDALSVRTLDDLRGLPLEAIATAAISTEAGPWMMDPLGMCIGEGASDTCYPIIDGYALPDDPSAIFREGRHNDVPLLTGSTLDDASGLAGIETLESFVQYLQGDMGALAEQALAAYCEGGRVPPFRASGNLLADRVFGWQNWTWARLAKQYGSQPVYYYEWTQDLPIPSNRYAERRLGAVHGAEMPFMFRNLDAYDWPWADSDHRLAEIVSRYWVNFATTGDPNGDGLPKWPSLGDEQGPALQLQHVPYISLPQRRQRFAILDRYYSAI